MAYQIKYCFNTGDSFGSEERESVLELEWEKLSVAKENLKRIDAHYKYYKALNGYSTNKKSRSELIKDNKYFDWFVDYKDLHEHCLILYSDDGGTFQLSAPWCGHFESLISTEIINKKEDMKFTY